MSEFDNYLFTRVAELEARLELADKRRYDYEQQLRKLQQEWRKTGHLSVDLAQLLEDIRTDADQ